MKKTLLSLIASASLAFSVNAVSNAEQLSDSNPGSELSINAHGEVIDIQELPLAQTRIYITNLAGQMVSQHLAWPENGHLRLNIEIQKPGIYLISIENNAGLQTVRKVYLG